MEHMPPGAEQGPERIQSAAIIFDGTIYRGLNHATAIRALERVHPDWQKKEYPVEGFLTNTNRFVDREEAGKIADQAEQLAHLPGEERDDAASELDSYQIRH